MIYIKLSIFIMDLDNFLQYDSSQYKYLTDSCFSLQQIFKMLMRAHRGKHIDWTKPFTLVESKALFQAIQINQSQAYNVTKQERAHTPIEKTQQIVVPKHEVVKRVTEPKKFAKINEEYIRIKEQLNLPKLQSYELNEVDHVFVQGHCNKFKINGKSVLTPDFLSRAFIQLQKKAGKDPVLPKNKNWLNNFIERQYKHIKQLPNYESFTEVFYNYWKNRRQELKFPMLRQLWRPNPEQITYLLAFKTRDKDKKMSRRSVNRLNEDDKVLQQLQSQFYLAIKVAERIQFRQKLKLKLVQSQLTSFHNDCKQFFQTPNFFSQFDAQSRSKDRQIFKKLQNETQSIKKVRSQQQEKQNQGQVNNTVISTFDQKQSVGQFLSTVINMCQNFGLSYQRLFLDKAVQKEQKQKNISIQKIPLQIQPKDEKCDYMSLQLYREKDTIYRTVSNIETTTKQFQIIPKSIFEYKAFELKQYYFGSDDEGQSKDLRKNISLNFKKYQQNKK